MRPRTFVELVGELRWLLNGSRGAEGKPSLKRAMKSVRVDPKPGDLSMSRLKLP